MPLKADGSSATYSSSVLRTAKRRKGMQTLQGEIRVDDFFYQAFVNPIFLPPESSDGHACPTDWDREAPASCSDPIVNPFSCGVTSGAEISSSRQHRSYSPNLFDDTESSIASFQDIPVLASLLPTPRIPNSRNSKQQRAATPNISSICTSTPSQESPSLVSHSNSCSPLPTAISNNDVSCGSESISRSSCASESGARHPHMTEKSQIGDSPQLPPKLTLIETGRKNLENLKTKLSGFIDARIPVNSSDGFASERVAAIRASLSCYETLFCQVDSLAVATELYHSVCKNILEIIRQGKKYEGHVCGPSIEDCWKRRDLIRYLVSCHIPHLLPPDLQNTDNVPRVDPVSLPCSREEVLRSQIARAGSGRCPQNNAINTVVPTGNHVMSDSRCEMTEVIATKHFISRHEKAPLEFPIGIKGRSTPSGEDSKDDINIESDPTTARPNFTNLCESFENLKAKMMELAAWKSDVDLVYHLHLGQRYPLDVASKLLRTGRNLKQFCDLSTEWNRLEQDVERCSKFQEKLRADIPMPSRPGGTDDSNNNNIPLPPGRTLSIKSLGPVISEYAKLPFSFEEGEMLNVYLSEAISWNMMVTAALNTKDLEKCEDLVDQYDGANSAVGVDVIESLREDVVAAHWIQRLEKLISGKKHISVAQLTEILTEKGRLVAERFKSTSATIELKKYCCLLEQWIMKAIQPPFVNLISPGEKAELVSILSLCRTCRLIGCPPPVSITTNQESCDRTNEGTTAVDSSASSSSQHLVGCSMSRVTEQMLESFLTEYLATKINVSVFRTIDTFRQRLSKWKKRQGRAVACHGTTSLAEAQAILREGLSLLEYVDLDVLVAELSSSISEHETWTVRVDDFLHRCREVLAECNVQRAMTQLLRLGSVHPQSDQTSEDGQRHCADDDEKNGLHVIVGEVIRVLAAPPHCERPSMTELTTLLSEQAESAIIDPDRSKLLHQLQDQADRWRRRARDCMKVSGKRAAAASCRLKLQLLLEAKYFSVDLKAEDKLGALFYIELWRKKVSSLEWPINETELLDLGRLPKSKHFDHLLSTTAIINRSTSAIEMSQTASVSEKDEIFTTTPPPSSSRGLPTEDQSFRSDDAMDDVAISLSGGSLVKGVLSQECANLIETFAGKKGSSFLHHVLSTIPEAGIISVLLSARDYWQGLYLKMKEGELCSQSLPKLEEWQQFLSNMEFQSPIHLESIHKEVEGFLIKAAFLSRILSQLPPRVQYSQLADLESELSSCPVLIPAWHDVASRLLKAARCAEEEAEQLLLAPIDPDHLNRLRDFLSDLPGRCEVGMLQLNIDSLTHTCRLKERAQKVEDWVTTNEALQSTGSHARLIDWNEHILNAVESNIQSSNLSEIRRKYIESEKWMALLSSLSRGKDKQQLDLHVAERLVSCPYGFGEKFSSFFDISREVSSFHSQYRPRVIDLLQKSDAQFQERLFWKAARQGYFAAEDAKNVGRPPFSNQQGDTAVCLTPIERIVELTRQLQILVDDVSLFKVIVVPEIKQNILTEIRMREFHLKLIATLRCAMPHTGCPLRQTPAGQMIIPTLSPDPSSCVWVVPEMACRELLHEAATWDKQDQQQQHVPLPQEVDLTDTLLSDEDCLIFPELYLLIEDIQQLIRNRDSVDNCRGLIFYEHRLDGEMINLALSRLEVVENWVKKTADLRHRSGLTPLLNLSSRVPRENFKWFSHTDAVWNVWGLPTCRKALQLRLSSDEGIDIPDSPRPSLDSCWDSSWRAWLLADQPPEQQTEWAGSQKKHSKAKQSSVATKKIVPGTFVTEFYVGRNLGLRISNILPECLIARISNQFKLTKSHQLGLNFANRSSTTEHDGHISVSTGAAGLSYSLNARRNGSNSMDGDDVESYRYLVTPTSFNKRKRSSNYSKEWSAKLEKIPESLKLQHPSLSDVVNLLKYSNDVCLEAIHREFPNFPLSHDVRDALLLLHCFSRGGCCMMSQQKMLDSSWIKKTTATDLMTTSDALDVFEQLELLPFQVQWKTHLLDALSATFQWITDARRLALLENCGSWSSTSTSVFDDMQLSTPDTSIDEILSAVILPRNAHIPVVESWDTISFGTVPSTATINCLPDLLHCTDQNTAGGQDRYSSRQLAWILDVAEPVTETDALAGHLSVCGICSTSGLPGASWVKCDGCSRWLHSECMNLDQTVMEALNSSSLVNYKLQCTICVMTQWQPTEDTVNENELNQLCVPAGFLMNSPWYKSWVNASYSCSRNEFPCSRRLLQLLNQPPPLSVDNEVEAITWRFSLLLVWMFNVSVTILSAKGLLNTIPPRLYQHHETGVDSSVSQSILTPVDCCLSQSPSDSPLHEMHIPMQDDLSASLDSSWEMQELYGKDSVTAGTDISAGQLPTHFTGHESSNHLNDDNASRRRTRSGTGCLRAKSARVLLGASPSYQAGDRLISTDIEDSSSSNVLSYLPPPQQTKRQQKSTASTRKRRGRPGKGKTALPVDSNIRSDRGDRDVGAVVGDVGQALEASSLGDGLFTFKKDGNDNNITRTTLVISGDWLRDQPTDLVLHDENSLIEFCDDFLRESVIIEMPSSNTLQPHVQSPWDVLKSFLRIQTVVADPSGTSVAHHHFSYLSSRPQGRQSIFSLSRLILSGIFIGLKNIPILSYLIKVMIALHHYDQSLTSLSLSNLFAVDVPDIDTDSSQNGGAGDIEEEKRICHALQVRLRSNRDKTALPISVCLDADRTIHHLIELSIQETGTECFFVPAEKSLEKKIEHASRHIQIFLAMLFRNCPLRVDEQISASLPLDLPYNVICDITQKNALDPNSCSSRLGLEGSAGDFDVALAAVTPLLHSKVKRLAQFLRKVLEMAEAINQFVAPVLEPQKKVSFSELDNLIHECERVWHHWDRAWSELVCARSENSALASSFGNFWNRATKRRRCRTDMETGAMCPDVELRFLKHVKSLEEIRTFGNLLLRQVNAVCELEKMSTDEGILGVSSFVQCLPDDVVDVLTGMSPEVSRPKLISIDALRKLVTDCQESCLIFERINIVKRFVEVHEKLRSELPTEISAHALSWDMYQTIVSFYDDRQQSFTVFCSHSSTYQTTAIESSPVFLGPEELNLMEASHYVGKWIEAVRNVTRSSTLPHRGGDWLVANSLRKSAATLVVDLSRTKLFSELRRCVRELKHRTQQDVSTVTSVHDSGVSSQDGSHSVDPTRTANSVNQPVWVPSFTNSDLNIMPFSSAHPASFGPMMPSISCIGHGAQFGMPNSSDYLTQHLIPTSGNNHHEITQPDMQGCIQPTFHFPIFALPANASTYRFVGRGAGDEYPMLHDEAFANVSSSIRQTVIQPPTHTSSIPGDG